MTKRKVRVGHCYRCVYTWRMRRQYPRICPRCKSRLWRIPKVRPVVLGHGLGIEEIVAPHRTAILRLGRKHGVRQFWVFGSVRRREATATSDVDLMVSWSRPVSLLDKAGLIVDLRATMGRNVDLVNVGGLHWAIEPQVEAEKVPL